MFKQDNVYTRNNKKLKTFNLVVVFNLDDSQALQMHFTIWQYCCKFM